jgi:hypothetical protein
MPRVCTICTHDQRLAIDRALVEGESAPRIAAKYRVSDDAITRHRAHIPAKLAQAQDAEEAAQADDLLRHVRALRGKSYALLQKAETAGDLKTALLGIREARACLELLAKLQGQLDERPIVNVLISPQWVALRAVILQTLAPYPDARAALAEALHEAERA